MRHASSFVLAVVMTCKYTFIPQSHLSMVGMGCP
jgi:hypothetical protein